MKFIIIHDGKKESEKMADILNASVSQFENIYTSTWTEKQYIDNKPTLSSEEYLLFIGRTKVAENIITAPSFVVKYEEFNMKYGWLGKQAVLLVDSKYSFNEDKIAKFTTLFNETFQSSTETEHTKKEEKNEFVKFFSGIEKKVKSIPTVGKVAVVAIGLPFAGIWGTIAAVTSTTYLIKGHVDSAKLNTDANKLLLSKFISNGLLDFLKTNE